MMQLRHSIAIGNSPEIDVRATVISKGQRDFVGIMPTVVRAGLSMCGPRRLLGDAPPPVGRFGMAGLVLGLL